jgi:hypothetical protein
VNLIQLPSGTKHCGDTRLLYIFMKFTMILFQFFKGLLFGKDTPRISDQENKFLDKKGTLEQMENHNVIRILVPRKIPPFFHAMYLIKCLLWK